jgi:hypothetical protein
MSICGNNKALDDLKAKQGELDGLLQGGKDQLAAMESKLNDMKADLESFKPELPQIDSLQNKLNELLSTKDPFKLIALEAEIKEKFGSAVADLDSTIANLYSGGDICSLVPNVEASADGTVKEQPTEPKVPEEPPAAPEPTPVIEKDLEELNKKLLRQSFNNNLKYIAGRASKIFKGFGSRKKNQKFYDSTWEEQWVELIEAAGGDYNTYRIKSRTLEELRAAQDKLKKKFPKSNWDFQKEGQILKETYDLVKEANPHLYADAQDFNIAASEWFKRRKAKLEKAAAAEV